jgi:hypothetical protein
MGHETTAIFRIIARVDNTTRDDDEYSIRYDQNWDMMSDTVKPMSMTTAGGYKIGQKKVTEFDHVYEEERSYRTTFAATVLAPNQPSIHGTRYTANYTIAIGNDICLVTTSDKNTNTDTVPTTTMSPHIPSNIFRRNDTATITTFSDTNEEIQNAAPETVIPISSSYSAMTALTFVCGALEWLVLFMILE